jgi:hypothetical protein
MPLSRSLLLTAIVVAAVVSIGSCKKKTPIEPDCTYAVAPVTASIAAAGGTGAVTVTAASSCSWTAQSNATWITLTSPASGTGSAQVSFTGTANPDTTARAGTLTVAGITVTVNQAGREPDPACTFAIEPQSADVGAGSTSGTVSVTTAAHCNWTVTSNASWLSVTSPASAMGSGTVAYAVAANPDPPGRTAELAIADKAFRVSQRGDPSGCTYNVAPTTLTPCVDAETLISSIATQSACPWTAESDDAWLTIVEGASGSGSATVEMSAAANYDQPRETRVRVRWPAPTAGQNILVQQAGCVYGVSPGTFTVAAGGETRMFQVVQQTQPTSCGGPLQNKCRWSAVSEVPWITIITPMPRVGDDPVNFTVAPNPTGAAREGTIRVRDQVVRITQGG